MFSQPQIKKLFDQYVVVQLYTDTVPPKFSASATSAEANMKLLKERFKTSQLPLYVILRPDGGDGTEVARYEEGKINNVEAFAEFLRKPLEDKR